MDNGTSAGRNQNGRGQSSIIILATILIVLMLGILGIGGYVIWDSVQLERASQEQAAVEKPLSPGDLKAGSGSVMVKNPIDFQELAAKNPDIYGWIYVPNTNVNLPILQSSEADNYYLNINYDKSGSGLGAIYSQASKNGKDFADPVTLLYGHTFQSSDAMFSSLHSFEDKDFFDANDEFYIYLPDRVLTYKVVSAYEYDDRHIMNAFDFANAQVREEYYQKILNPESMVANVREGSALSSNDKIVQLSTCTKPANQAARYLVTGVLTNDQPAVA